MTFSKPENSLKLDPAVMDPSLSYYKIAKKEVQSCVIRHCLQSEWTVEVPPLSDSSNLVTRVKSSGFEIEAATDDSIKSTWDTTKNRVMMKVKLPEQPLPEKEEGYFSDGWEKEFKASIVQKKVQNNLNEKYNMLLYYMQDGFNKDTTINKFEFKLENRYPPIVLEWIKSEFIAAGIKIEVKDCKGRYFHFITCINPKVNNTLRKSIEILF